MSALATQSDFEEIYDLIRDCAWDKLDAILDAVDVEVQTRDTLLGYLNASFAGRRYLAGRVRLFERVEAKLRADAVATVDHLLRGLR